MGNGRSSYIIGEIPQKIHKVTPDRVTPRVQIRNFFLSKQWSVMRNEMKLDKEESLHVPYWSIMASIFTGLIFPASSPVFHTLF